MTASAVLSWPVVTQPRSRPRQAAGQRKRAQTRAIESAKINGDWASRRAAAERDDGSNS
jgi:hypothetical protein